MNVVIAGAGIAGVATALALRRAGHTVEIHERAPAPGEVGAGLAIWPNGSKALAALGVEDVPGCPVHRLQLRSRRDRLLSDPPLGQLEQRYGYPLVMVHRAELHALLLDHLGDGSVRFGSEVTGFVEEAAGPRVSLSDGEAVKADVLVGADGIRSAVRHGLLRDGEPPYSGATCWRGVTRFDLEPGSAFNWWGRGGEFGVFPLPGGRVYWFAVQNRPEAESQSGQFKTDLTAAFAGWPALVGSVLDATDEAAIIRNDLYDRRPVRTWSRGRVTLAGDAAHPMLPNVAQGACQALEDAVALARALDAGPVDDAFAAYERSRMDAASRLVTQARQTARIVQTSNPMVTGLRDLVIARLPGSLVFRQLDALMR